MNKKLKIKKLLSYYKPYKKTLFLDLFFAVSNALLVLGTSVAVLRTKDLILDMQKDEALRVVWILAAFIPIFFLILYVCNHYIMYYGHIMGAKIERDMRAELFSHYQELPLGFYDNEKIGQLMSRLTTDLNNISEFLHHTPEDLIIFCIRLAGTFIILLSVNRTISFTTMFIPCTLR